ncbi:MAG: sodium transporter [Pirellulaceae bacterium]|nr:MAG: sodium transporter [Pirellulaceae bacterium]
MRLHPVDGLVIVAYFAAILVIGYRLSRGMRSSADFFLAGRSLPWWAIGMSLVATDIGGTDIVGVAGAAYRYGLAVANFEWIGCVPAMIVAAFVFVPHFWRLGITTLPEFMERRYNPLMRLLLAFCWLVFMACNLGVMLLASAKMLLALGGLRFSSDGAWAALAGWELALAIVILGITAGAYTLAGGLAAVVYTDVLQCAVMIGGCLLVALLSLVEVGGWTGLLAALETHAANRAGVPSTELILPVDTESPFPWTGIFFGLALVLSPAYWWGNQAIVQRSLGARSEFEAKASYVWGALLKNLIPLLIAVPGIAAAALFPQLTDADEAFPWLAATILPVGLRGLFLAAFVAALMSSVDSYLNSAATILTHDFLGRYWRSTAQGRTSVRSGRIVTALLTLWAILFALWLSGLEGATIYGIFQTMMSFFQGPALAVLLAGLFWSRATPAGAVAGFVAGVVTSLVLFAMQQPIVYQTAGWKPLFQIREPYLYYSVWSFLMTWLVIAIVSCVTPRVPAERIRPLLLRGGQA